MVCHKKSKLLLDNIKVKIESDVFMRSSRVNGKDFTRDRKMPFPFLVYFMINSIKQTLQKS